MKDVLTKQVQPSNATWSRTPAVQADFCLITTNIILLVFWRKGRTDSDFAVVLADELQQPQETQETELCLEEPIPDDESCASDEGSMPDNKSDASDDSDHSDASGISLVVAASKPWGRKVSGLNMATISNTSTAADQPATSQEASL